MPHGARPRTASKALAAACLSAACLSVTGCATVAPAGGGPAELSVVKQPAPQAGAQRTLEQFDPDTTPGAASVQWSKTLHDLWLPQAVDVVAGVDGAQQPAGSVYLTVPANYQVTQRVVTNHLNHRALSHYSAIHVAPDQPKSATTAGTSASANGAIAASQLLGTVIQGDRDLTRYVVTVAPAPDRPAGFSAVMVQWSPTPGAADPSETTAPD